MMKRMMHPPDAPVENNDDELVQDPSKPTFISTLQKVQIFVKTYRGTSITIDTPLSASVLSLKTLIRQKEGVPEDDQLLTFGGRLLEDGCSLNETSITKESTIDLSGRLRGAGCPLYRTEPQFFDNNFDYDFTNLPEDEVKCQRGGKNYYRPIGSKRYALKVWNKYGDNVWLGIKEDQKQSTTREWPVAYHGTPEYNVRCIAKAGFRIANGQRFAFGKGIYCSPDPKTALEYSPEYKFESRKWKLILQLRVNPNNIKIIDKSLTPEGYDEYWILPEDSDLRPYGICIYPVPVFFDSSRCFQWILTLLLLILFIAQVFYRLRLELKLPCIF